MGTHEIHFVITPQGKVEAETKGVKGKGCEKYMELISRILGPVDEVTHTRDYYEPDEKVILDIEERI